MHKSISYLSMLGLALGVVFLAGNRAVSSGQSGALVRLQPSSPGTPQSGHFNINGVGNVRNLKALEPSFASGVTGYSNGTNSSSTHPGGNWWPAGGEFAGPNGLIAATGSSGGIAVVGLSSQPSSYAGAFLNDATSGGTGVYVSTASSDAWALSANGGLGTTTNRLSIGTTDASYPIQMAGALGDKISLWGGTGAHYGFGVQNSLLQIHSDQSVSDIAFGYGRSDAFNENVRFKGNGNVGIGTNNPGAKLDVSGSLRAASLTATNGAAANTVFLGDAGGNGSWGTVGSARLTNDAASLSKVTGGNFVMNGAQMVGQTSNSIALKDGTTNKVQIWPNGSGGSGVVQAYGPNGNANATMSFLSSFPNNGFITAQDLNGANPAGIYINSSNQGIVYGTVKSFIVPDPENDARDITYACIEGPEAAMYTRGTGHLVDGQAVIELPDHFLKLANMGTATIQVTPLDECEGLFVKKEGGRLIVKELRKGTSSIDFDWRVEAVRKGFEDWKVERPWDDALPAGDKKQQWEARLRSIAARRNQQKP